jgi:acetyl esterase/lipase
MSMLGVRIRMLPAALLTTALLAVAALAVAQTGTPPAVVYLWPKGAPGFEDRKDVKENTTFTKDGVENQVKNVNNPSITVHLPAKEKATGAAIVICPGGGHSVLGANGEGHAVAKWLADHGIAGFVLKYRLEREKGSPYKIEVHALQDAQRAIRTVRANAKEWGVDPKRVGILGFSAGGELAALASTRRDPKSLGAEPIDKEDAHPDFQVLIYPGGRPETFDINKETPPTFLLVAGDDRLSDRTMAIFAALRKAGVPAELHVYARGGHGFGMHEIHAPVAHWPARLQEWMEDRGLSKKP